MSKGFLIYAQNTDQINYIEQAYLLALSIKRTQSVVTSVSLVTNDKLPANYLPVFDNVIPVPWFKKFTGPLAAEHRWKLYHISPYDETIVMDADMLLLTDISQWWDYSATYDLKFCSQIANYKHEKISVDTHHRKAFIANNLPNPYFGLHYFKKSDAAHDFYKVLEFVCNNWQECYTMFAPLSYQDWLSMDLAVAITIEMMGIHADVIDVNNPMLITHMKPALQGWQQRPVSWQHVVQPIVTNNCDLLVANIRQQGVFHYVDETFVTQEIIKKFEVSNV